MKVGSSTQVHRLGYRHCIQFGMHRRDQWQRVEAALISQFGEPARRRHFRTDYAGSKPHVARVHRQQAHTIENALWFSDTRHWDHDWNGYWCVFRDTKRFNLALLIAGDIP